MLAFQLFLDIELDNNGKSFNICDSIMQIVPFVRQPPKKIFFRQ